MQIKAVKKEVEALPEIPKQIELLQKEWIRPVKDIFLPQLDSPSRNALKKELNLFNKTLDNLQFGENIHNKLRQQARYLVELKLTTFNGDNFKQKILTNQLLNDDLFNIKQTISDIKSFESEVEELNQQYQEINYLLQQGLSLEEHVSYHDLPHKIILQNLSDVSKKQMKIIKQLGKEFVDLTRK